MRPCILYFYLVSYVISRALSHCSPYPNVGHEPVVRASVSDWRTFPDVCLIYG